MPKIGRTNILSEQIYTKEGERLLLTLKTIIYYNNQNFITSNTKFELGLFISVVNIFNL